MAGNVGNAGARTIPGDVGYQTMFYIQEIKSNPTASPIFRDRFCDARRLEAFLHVLRKNSPQHFQKLVPVQEIRTLWQSVEISRTIGYRYNRGVGMTTNGEKADAFDGKRNG